MGQITGTIIDCRYYNEETSFGVYQANVDGNKGPIIVTGAFPRVYPGERFEADASYETRYNKYTGKNEPQWKVREKLLPSLPLTPKAIRSFLGSGFAYKIGDSVAKSLVDTHGEKTLDLINEVASNLSPYLKDVPEESRVATIKKLNKGPTKQLFAPLLAVPGVGIVLLSHLLAGWEKNKSTRDVMLYIYGLGIRPNLASRLIKKYGDKTLETIQDNPYKLLELPGVSFKIADMAFASAGGDALDIRRLGAALCYVIKRTTMLGNSTYPAQDVKITCNNMLSKYNFFPAVHITEAIWDSVIQNERQNKTIVSLEINNTPFLSDFYLYNRENSLASLIKTKSEQHKASLQTKVMGHVITNWEQKNNCRLDDSQKDALNMLATEPLCILTGGPGTGKTTLIRLFQNYLTHIGHSFEQCAPTGKAARNMSEEGKTIHRLLGLRPDNPSFYNERVTSNVLIVDEVSMMGVELAEVLFRASTGHTRTILVGDSDQLPSVDAGTVLGDLVMSNQVPIKRLNTVHRTKEGGIIENAAAIREIQEGDPHGSRCLTSGSEFTLKYRPTQENMLSTCLEHIAQAKETQVLAPMKKGLCGTENLNRELQKILNPSAPGKKEIKDTFFNCTWREDDKIINTVNDYTNYVFNGENGVITNINDNTGVITVDYPEINTRVDYQRVDRDKLLHAYAITIHKSQGSEYKNVVLILPSSARKMAAKNLLYTGLTRAKKTCILYSTPQMLDLTLSKQHTGKRYSLLKSFLQGNIKLDLELDQYETRCQAI